MRKISIVVAEFNPPLLPKGFEARLSVMMLVSMLESLLSELE
jgi:hypothetical protein